MYKFFHTLKCLHIRFVVMILAACAACAACDDNDQSLMADLTDGYWLSQQIDIPEFIISFSSSGQSFCYVCATSDDGGYDAYYDSSLTSFYKYAVDVANGRLCFMPDQWFDILILNENILSLCADDGTMLRFTKVNADSVNVVSPEQFRQLHPDAR